MQSTLPELTQLVAEARRYRPTPITVKTTETYLALSRHFVPVDDLTALLRTHDDLPWEVCERDGVFWAALSIAGTGQRVELTLFADYDREGKTLPEVGRP